MLKKIIKEIKEDDNVIAAYLFGSHGTKRQMPLSDIDICLFTKKNSPKTLLKSYSYGSDLVDISVFDALPLYIQPEVFKGKPLFIKNKDFIARKFAVSFRDYQDSRKYYQNYWKGLKKRLRK